MAISETLIALGRRVRDHRRAAGLTQQDVAVKVDLNRSSIANIESGRQDVSVTKLVAIAGVLGVTPADLLTANADVTQEQLMCCRTANRALVEQVAAVRAALTVKIEPVEFSAGGE